MVLQLPLVILYVFCNFPCHRCPEAYAPTPDEWQSQYSMSSGAPTTSDCWALLQSCSICPLWFLPVRLCVFAVFSVFMHLFVVLSGLRVIILWFSRIFRVFCWQPFKQNRNTTHRGATTTSDFLGLLQSCSRCPLWFLPVRLCFFAVFAVFMHLFVVLFGFRSIILWISRICCVFVGSPSNRTATQHTEHSKY